MGRTNGHVTQSEGASEKCLGHLLAADKGPEAEGQVQKLDLRIAPFCTMGPLDQFTLRIHQALLAAGRHYLATSKPRSKHLAAVKFQLRNLHY